MNYILLCFLTQIQLYIFVSSKGACGPKGVDKKGVYKTEIRQIVRYHNRYRLKIARGKIKGQPKGLNLFRIRWDKGLAKEAQKHAEECKFVHNKPKDSRFSIGQNLFMKFTTKPEEEKWFEAITTWFKEHIHYTFGPIPKKPSKQMTGHYTQVIWANTYLVGCGFARYLDNKKRSTQLYVCNYGPAGNIQGVEPYKTKGPNKCPRLCHHPNTKH